MKNWIKNRLRNKIPFSGLIRGKKKEVPDDLWEKCSSCARMVYSKELRESLHVCPHCTHHMRMNAQHRLEMLFDGGNYEPIEAQQSSLEDPLRFQDRERYDARLKKARKVTGLSDSMLAGEGLIHGAPVVAAALDFRFLGGSLGSAAGETLLAASARAVESASSLVVVTSSGGARMQEGILSLMQMPRTVIAVERVREAGLPVVVVLADPTTGGVTASFGMLGDIHIAEPGALIGFAGQRVIEETIRESLPSNFQRAEYLLEHGMIDLVVPRSELATTLGRILSLLRADTASQPA